MLHCFVPARTFIWQSCLLACIACMEMFQRNFEIQPEQSHHNMTSETDGHCSLCNDVLAQHCSGKLACAPPDMANRCTSASAPGHDLHTSYASRLLIKMYTIWGGDVLLSL
jgi:hypothetical protein